MISNVQILQLSYCTSWIIYYRPQAKFAKVFTGICLSRRRGVCPIACWDTPPLGTRGRHPLADTRWADTPLGRHLQVDPPAQSTPVYGQKAGGTHPIGMHSCINEDNAQNSFFLLERK